MRKKICDVEDRIRFIFTYRNLVLYTVCRVNNTVNGKRDRSPLILLDTAVIVSLKVYCLIVLIDGIRLKIEPGLIDMSTEDIEAFAYILLTDNGHDQALILDARINLIACLELLLGLYIDKAE